MASVSVPWGLNHYYSVLDEKVTVRVLGTVNATTGVELVSAAPTRGLPAVDSPTLLFCALSAYLCAVCGGSLWIRVAGLKPRSREPLLLKMLVFLHNSFCLGLSVYMCAGIVTESFRLKFAMFCNAPWIFGVLSTVRLYFLDCPPEDLMNVFVEALYSVWGNAYKDDETKLAFFIYLFYISKIFELMDTGILKIAGRFLTVCPFQIIMLLKRNVRQITVLHVYHHVSIAIIWWIIAHHAPGGDAYFSAAMNSAVHVVMYFYYLLSSILRSNQKLRIKYLFWGKYLTQVQMIQFGLNMVQAYYCIKTQAPYPRFLCKVPSPSPYPQCDNVSA
eukprot:Gb_35879 [translate_table: standard]